MDDMNDNWYDDNPCLTCDRVDWCDGWEAQFCCDRCRYDGCDDCDNCDPMDI